MAASKPSSPRDTAGGGGKEVVFHVEVLSASGLPRVEKTIVRLSGFGIEAPVTSLPVDDSDTPAGWLFPAAEAAEKEPPPDPIPKAGKGKKDAPAPVPPPIEVAEIISICKALGTAEERQQLLDDICCAPLQLILLRQAEPCVTLGTASLDLQEVVHATGSASHGGGVEVSASVQLTWSPELLAELQAEHDAAIAAAAKEAAEAAAASLAEGGDGVADSPGGGEDASARVLAEVAAEMAVPPPGEINIRVATAGRIGQLLCPEDLDDWTVLSVNVDGLFNIPPALIAAGGAPPQDEAGVYETPGVYDQHALNYSIRVMGLELNGGQLVLPEAEDVEWAAQQRSASDGMMCSAHAGEDLGDGVVPLTSDATAAVAALASADGGLASSGDGFENRRSSRPMQVVSVDSVVKQTFVESLARAGFVTAHTDGAALFDFLDSAQFGALAIGAPSADVGKVIGLHDYLVEKFSGLDEAFQELETAAEGHLDLDGFRSGLESIGYPAAQPDDIDALFTSIDPGDGTLTKDSIKALAIHRRMAELQAIEKLGHWLLECCGSLQNMIRQIDDTKSGTISAASWGQALERLGYQMPSEERRYPRAPKGLPAPELVFKFLDVHGEGNIEPNCLSLLEKLDTAALAKALPKFEEVLFASVEDEAKITPGLALQRLHDLVLDDGLTVENFEAGYRRLGCDMKIEPRLLFALLADDTEIRRINLVELASLQAYLAAARHSRLAICKAFLVNTFGGVSAEVHQKLFFDSNAELFKVAERAQPRVVWPEPQAAGYRGRKWLQQLLNTLGDERGRNLAADAQDHTGGTWLYLFPCLKGQNAPSDVAQAEPTQVDNARLARWHHAQGFVDLRRLKEPVPGGPEVSFRVFLSQVADVGDLPGNPFAEARMYLKGTVKLDRPLSRLCPRDMKSLPKAPGGGAAAQDDGGAGDEDGGQSLIPPPPEKKPPPTTSEELELEVRRVVGQLAREFSRMCHERGLEEPQITGPGGAIGAYKLLGRGMQAGTFLSWLLEQDGGGMYRDLSAQIRPAIVRLVRAEARDGPSCALSGDEKDAMYTSIRDMLLKHIFRALNHDLNVDSQRRDAELWSSPCTADSTPPGKKAATSSAHGQSDDGLLRLAFEYEVGGEYGRATELYEEHLALPQNVENSDAWFGFARFLVRSTLPTLRRQIEQGGVSQSQDEDRAAMFQWCEQRLMKAEKALRFALSVRPPSAGPQLHESAFLALYLQCRQLPSALDWSTQTEPQLRFDAACSLLMGYADKHPTDCMTYYFLFVVHAAEARNLHGEATAAAASDDLNLSLEAIERVEDASLRLKAQACKYLELARATPTTFTSTLGGAPGDGSAPGFPDFDALRHLERLSQGEAVEPPAQRLDTPSSWAPAGQGIWEKYEAVHPLPSQDDAMAMDCIDLLLHFGVPGFVEFLITEAAGAYGFLSPATAASERIRAAVLEGDWSRAKDLIGELFRTTDSIREAHALLGECCFRAVRDSPGGRGAPAAAYADAVAAFRSTLDFTPNLLESEAGDGPHGEDPAVHLRLGSIYFKHAEESGFSDEAALRAAMDHLKRSLIIAPTAEAWRCAGVCSYQEACLRRKRLRSAADAAAADAGAGTSAPAAAAGAAALAPESLFGEAVRFLTEANTLDRRRPQINAWLALCAAETGRVQIARQAIRQVLRFGGRLDAATALWLATPLLRFSDESRAIPGERPRFVQNGRYAREVVAVLQLVLGMQQKNAEARYMLARAHALLGEDATAVAELRVAIPQLLGNPECGGDAMETARTCAAQLVAGRKAYEKPDLQPPEQAFDGASPGDFFQEDTSGLFGGLLQADLYSPLAWDMFLAALRPKSPMAQCN
eukprot:CAMPEP_0117468402 /NCGR_PEP_ID=MMETSP0784-20121206/6159_1 /TAXON_ID=39447 /ORGANISM="" /LENGTH=1846 /DNA_ID=CAMNT_0005262413 /DNA_START=28 /DNA_END=5570 /DNA_ORIENTATION=-